MGLLEEVGHWNKSCDAVSCPCLISLLPGLHEVRSSASIHPSTTMLCQNLCHTNEAK